MRADNTHHLVTAARRRGELTRAKTIRALRLLDAEGGAVTFQIVAQKAQVSRSWLYTQPDIALEVRRLRDLHRSALPTPSALPVRQRSTDGSLRQRLICTGGLSSGQGEAPSGWVLGGASPVSC